MIRDPDNPPRGRIEPVADWLQEVRFRRPPAKAAPPAWRDRRLWRWIAAAIVLLMLAIVVFRQPLANLIWPDMRVQRLLDEAEQIATWELATLTPAGRGYDLLVNVLASISLCRVEAGAPITVLDLTEHRMRALLASSPRNDRAKAVRGSRVLVLGLAYKPGTSALRRSPSVELIRALLRDGAHVRAFDPHVSSLPDELNSVQLCPDARSVASGADALVVVAGLLLRDLRGERGAVLPGGRSGRSPGRDELGERLEGGRAADDGLGLRGLVVAAVSHLLVPLYLRSCRRP